MSHFRVPYHTDKQGFIYTSIITCSITRRVHEVTCSYFSRCRCYCKCSWKWCLQQQQWKVWCHSNARDVGKKPSLEKITNKRTKLSSPRRDIYSVLELMLMTWNERSKIWFHTCKKDIHVKSSLHLDIGCWRRMQILYKPHWIEYSRSLETLVIPRDQWRKLHLEIVDQCYFNPSQKNKILVTTFRMEKDFQAIG